MSFEQLQLSPLILKAIKAKGHTTPTQIQQDAIPVILSGKDVIAKAPTGTGKTGAFMLPAIERVAQSKNRQKPQILVLAPTRELASQTDNVANEYGSGVGIKTVSILGGMPYREQQRKLSRPVDVIIATPGRLIDYIERGDLDLSSISMLILDEADRMLDMGFIEDVEFIASKIPKKRQTLLFTATMDKRLISLSQNILRAPHMIEVKNANVTLDNISQRIHLANDNEHKFKLLKHLLSEENIFKAIIFSATKRNADKLVRDLTQDGHRVSALHGDLNQRKRNKVIADFRTGKIQFLIATDVAARGIDIDDVSHVINYDLPKFAEDYVHRIGRTGRAGRDGIAISFVLSSDHPNLKKIERFTVQTIPHSTIKGLEPKPQTRSHGGGGGHGGGRGDKRSFGGGSGQKRSFGGGQKRSFGDKPKRSFGDKPERSFGDKPKRSFGDRPERSGFGDKPKRSFSGNTERGNFGDKPKRSFGDRPERSFGDKPKRSFGDRPERGSFGDKPKKSFEGNSERGNFGDKPKRSFSDRPERGSFGDKPKRSFEGNSERGNFGDKPKRSFGDRPERSFGERSEKRSFGDKPKRSFGDKPERSFGDKPKKSFGGNTERGNFGDKPKKTFGGRDFVKKDFSKDAKKPFKRHFKKDKDKA
ncbi:MAG TPA: DEAD/DEAH box helicase [Gammaproteobacteria bacterium]|nr:DEAD/DEAH box helicase [Gammaproteobacteria bacterium]